MSTNIYVSLNIHMAFKKADNWCTFQVMFILTYGWKKKTNSGIKHLSIKDNLWNILWEVNEAMWALILKHHTLSMQ